MMLVGMNEIKGVLLLFFEWLDGISKLKKHVKWEFEVVI